MRNRGRKAPNPLSRSYESNGPDVKVRGTAQHVAEKYIQLSRDAHVAGDPVLAENYLQHAEHYCRIILAAQAQFPQSGGLQRPFDDDQDDMDEPGAFGGFMPVQEYGAPQPETHQSDSRRSDNRYGEGEQSPAPYQQRDRLRMSERQDRSEAPERGERQERSERYDRNAERPDRRERFRRRRDDINGNGHTPNANSGNGHAMHDNAETTREPSLPAFLTTPVRTVSDEDDVRPAAPAPAPVASEKVSQKEEAPVAREDVARESSVREEAAHEVSAVTDESAAPRTRRRRTTTAAVADEAEAAAPVKKLRATRTRKKAVEGAHASDEPVPADE